MADAPDSKSGGVNPREGSSPSSGTNLNPRDVSQHSLDKYRLLIKFHELPSQHASVTLHRKYFERSRERLAEGGDIWTPACLSVANMSISAPALWLRAYRGGPLLQAAQENR